MKTTLAVTSLILSLGYAVILAGQLAGRIEFTLLTSPPVFIGSLALAIGLILIGRRLVRSRAGGRPAGEFPPAGGTSLGHAGEAGSPGAAGKFRAPSLAEEWVAAPGPGLALTARKHPCPKIHSSGRAAHYPNFE